MKTAYAIPFLLFAAFSSNIALAQHPDIGQVQLRNEVGVSNVDGTGVSLLQVEVPNNAGNYGPDSANSQHSTKTFDDPVGDNSGGNSHATNVGTMIYGNTRGVATGIGESGSPPITIFDVNSWLFSELGANFQGDTTLNQAPLLQNYDVSNHSYAGQSDENFTDSDLENALQRMDWMVNQTDMTTVVGTANNGTASPPLFTNSYNEITVGHTVGNHPPGLTTLNGSGRLTVDVVAPTPGFATTTSNATGVVSGAAAILHQTGNGIADAKKSEVIKATLLAGATKEEFADWSRTSTRPLDRVFGAGEVNIYNSYQIQQGGQLDAEISDPANIAGENGWDFETDLETGGERFYEFVVGADQALEDFSVILNWNAVIEDTNVAADIFEPSLEVADLSLELFNSTDGFLDVLVVDGLSDSPVDNIEHLYLSSLDSGTYHLRVANSGTGSITTDYGLAFRSTLVAVPEPSSVIIVILSSIVVLSRRRKF